MSCILGGDIVIASGDLSWLGKNLPPCDPTYLELLRTKKRDLITTIYALADDHEIPTPRRAKQLAAFRMEKGEENWLSWVTAYLCSTMEAIDDPVLLRETVVSLANVIVGWIEQLDREAA